MVEKARAFAFVALGVFALVAAYQLGARHAEAQPTGSTEFVAIAATPGNSNPVNTAVFAITAGGDVYATAFGTTNCDMPWNCAGWVYTGSVLQAPTPAAPSSWGEIKSGFRGKK